MFGGLTFGGAPFAGVVAAVAGLFASPSVAITATAQFANAHAGLAAYNATFGGAPFGGVPFAGTVTGTSRLAATVAIRVGLADPNLRARSNLAAAADIAITAAPQLTTQVRLRAAARIEFDASADLARLFGGEFWLGGVNVTKRVRKAGVSIRDVLNDAPNTASLTFGGTAVPQVGLPLEIRISHPLQVLFSGAIQSVDRSYESIGNKAALVHWPCSAIDDTAAANRRRPFGSWVDTSASTVALALATYAPVGFTTHIAPDLPPVTFTCDGSETLIAALVRLANLVGGYAKIENKALYLFIEDTADAPDPVDLAHPPLNDPPISMTIDASQLRTRVYGKGYGEQLPTDVNAGESLVPIRDGAQFTATGGKAIAGTTADSAQSQHITYAGLSRPTGGTLVGPGAAPANAPTLSLAAGGVVTNGAHQLGVVHVTAAGKSLIGPLGTVSAGAIAPPAAALTAGVATNGTGPDQGSHDYVVTNLMLGGETTPSPASNAVTTSSAVGQIAAPTSAPVLDKQAGSGVTDGSHDYAVTFVTSVGETERGAIGGAGSSIAVGPVLTGQLPNPQGATVGTVQQGAGVDNGYHMYGVTFLDANGETQLGATGGQWTLAQSILTGQLPTAPGSLITATTAPGAGVNEGTHYWAVTFGDANGDTPIQQNEWRSAYVGIGSKIAQNNPNWMTYTKSGTAGSMPAKGYWWCCTFGDQYGGETDKGQYDPQGFNPSPSTSIDITNIPIGGPNTTKRYLYRASDTNNWHRVGTLNDNTSRSLNDGLSESQWGPAVSLLYNTTGTHHGVVNLTNVPIGPAGTTNRKIWRDSGSGFRYVGTIANNNGTTFTDTTPNANLGAAAPTQNTTGSMVPWNQILVTNIPTGPAGTTGRRLYRNPNTGVFLYVADIGGNSSTSYLDTKPNNQLGAAAPPSNTTGAMTPNNQILVAGIQTGPAGTTSRRLYRRFNGTGPHLFVVTIGNNSVTTYTDTRPNSSLGSEAPVSNTTGTAVQKVPLTGIPLGPAGTSGRNIYRRFNGSGTFKLVTTLANNTSTTYNDGTSNAGLGAAAPSANTAVGNQITLAAIPTGAAAVLAREIYMTLAGPGATLHLALTLADNTTTTATINISDATLAGQPYPPPTSDTSGLQQPQGQVNPGSPTLIVASPSPFDPGGGWVVTGGGQVLRYYGISGQYLTGIPASGAGAIVTTILYGQQATPAPTLIGVSGLGKPVQRGASIHIWVQRDDLQAQSEQAARDGSDGIVEFLLSDERRSEPSLIARCDADLALFARPIVTVQYATRDLKTKSGKRVAINLPMPPISAVLTIQDVTISEIDMADGLRPRFTVTASSVRFSLEDTLRRLVVG